jgi:hypothetical protein
MNLTRTLQAAVAALALTAAACNAPTKKGHAARAVDVLDIHSVPVDLQVPPISSGAPTAGRRVCVTAPEYAGTEVHHVLYLPSDWVAGQTYPVLVEYAGNGPYRSKRGDVSSGLVEGSSLGYGISGGVGFLWLCLPFVDETGTHNQRQWWGSVQRTVDYCKAVVPRVCAQYGGDPQAIVLVGFSRGAIACNYIGLRDAEIAALWRGFVCHSHYDGVRAWPYANSNREAAAERLTRLGDRPQWISHERSVDTTQHFLDTVGASGRFTFRALPYDNHTDTWALRDIPLRRELRTWVADVTSTPR